MKFTSKFFVSAMVFIFSVNLALAAFCVKCGTKLKENVKFCPDCGHRLGAPLNEDTKVRAKPKPVPVYEDIEEANAYFDLAEKEEDSVGAFLLPHIKKRRYEKALNLYKKILEKWPNSNKCEYAAYNIANIYESYAYKKYDKAIDYYKMVIDINPQTVLDTRLKIATVTEDKIHDFEGAIPLYEETIADARVQDEKEKAAKRLKRLKKKIEYSKNKISK